MIENITITDLFLQQVYRNPDKIAIVSESRKYTFQELNKEADSVATFLMDEHGIQSEDIVTIKIKRSEWQIIIALGIMKAGAAYLPIDSNYPTDRINYIHDNSKSKFFFDENQLASFRNQKKKYDKGKILPATTSESLAYVIYTSGSTGKPKGVMVEHRNAVSMFENLKNVFTFRSDTVIGAITNYTFDISVLEMFGALCIGNTVWYLIDTSVEGILNLLNKKEITALQLTPSRFAQLHEVDKSFIKRLHSLDILLVGGEPMRQKQYEILRNYLSDVNVFNVYGPTETTIWSTSLLLKHSTGLTIGKPLLGEEVYVLDELGESVNQGSIGEICIGGSGVSRGYLNNAELTKKKFVSNPYKAEDTLYKTGDRAKMLFNGELEYLGREDDQVKIRGHRIELGEIEEILRNMESITEAVVVMSPNDFDNPCLVAFLKVSTHVELVDIQEYVSRCLPHYMFPNQYVVVDEFQLNSSGKIDKSTLFNCDALAVMESTFIPPRNEVDKKLICIWQDTLQREHIGIRDNFFHLGGHSVKAMIIITRVQEEFGLHLDMQTMLLEPTIEHASNYLSLIQGGEQVESEKEEDELII